MGIMTKNGCSTTIKPGSEQYEEFTTRIGGRTQSRVNYDYRTFDGVLFSCVGKTLEGCRTARDAWMKTRESKA